jgi:hypothetical protein
VAHRIRCSGNSGMGQQANVLPWLQFSNQAWRKARLLEMPFNLSQVVHRKCRRRAERSLPDLSRRG